MDIENRKFYNILKGIKIDEINKETIEILLSKNIIIDTKTIPGEQFDYNFKLSNYDYTSESEISSTTHFEERILFENVEYVINQEIIEEIYFTIEFCVENLEGVNEWDKAEIEIELEGILQIEEKFKYLQDKHLKLINKIKREPEYLVYSGKKDFNGYYSWKEMASERIMNESELIINYLTNNFKMPNYDLYKQWLKYYRIKFLTDFCKLEIENLNNNSNKENDKSKLDTSKQILMIERIRNINNWENISATKKGKIISVLIGKNKDNIKDLYLTMEKNLDEQTNKFKSDQDYIDKLIDSILG